MAARNEAAVTLRWLLDDLNDPLTAAWIDVRDRMRVRTGQTVTFPTDWISDPWVTRGIQPAAMSLRTATPMYDPPDDIAAWPDFGVAATTAAAPLTLRRTRHQALNALISPSEADVGDGMPALEEFLASERLIGSHGDEHMVCGEQVRAWVLACLGSLLRGIVFSPPETDSELIAKTAAFRIGAPLQMTLPKNWEQANRFGDRHLELLLNLTVQPDGAFAPLDPADLRVGQGLPWQQAWRWLSVDVRAERSLAAIRLAARLLRHDGLRMGVRRAVTSADERLRTLATGVLRRWTLTLEAMAWAEYSLGLPWEAIRPADVACFAFSATKPEWPRRLLAISHRSAEVKPQLRHMGVWKSSRCAIDATYIPSWETNTGMIWGLFAATPAIVRVRTPGYETSIWCRREAEMVRHLLDRADYFSQRLAGDIDHAQLESLDEWETVARGRPRDAVEAVEPEFPAFGLTVWSPRPSPSWELAVLRAAGALRTMSAFIWETMGSGAGAHVVRPMVNRILDELRTHGDFTVVPAPTNHPGGWRSYAIIFEAVAALSMSSPSDPFPLRLPDAYTNEDMVRDSGLTDFIPDLTSGIPRLDDVLVAIEFLRTRWPVLVEQGRGRFLILNLQGVSRQQWIETPEWSLHRGLAALRGLPVPLWFLQLGNQDLSDWGLPGDPPILTEHIDAQFGWMFEGFPEPAHWRARYPADSGLSMSDGLRRLHQS
jgi:hypothetical protein